ncbi:PAS domain-containing protein [Labilibacter sediminis]|nr:PAS domain-containing protein [Labilibacter sediminis]
MNSYSIHKITSFINEYLSSHLKDLFNEPFRIMLLDENKKLVLKWDASPNEGTLGTENAMLISLQNLNHSKQIKDTSLGLIPIQLHNTSYHIGICIQGDAAKADAYLRLIKALLKESVQAYINQQVINKNEQFTFAIMNSIHFGVIATNLTGGIIYANDNACRTLNIRRRELLNLPIKSLLHNWDSVSKIVSSGNTIQNEEFVFVTPAESMKFSVNVSPINDANDNKIGFVITLRSIDKVYQLVNKYTGMHARYSFDDIIGKSRLMRQVIDYAKTISNSPSTILIEGESGTGKEVFAQSIHNASNRNKNSFVAINCAAIAENLIESELFGYDDGAFTGAKKGGHPGKFELANNGTLFLDEIGDMKPDMQVKLLRAIQESSITRVGGNKVIPIDVRIIAATNKNLQQEVENGNFRMDLYYRISVIPLLIPSLRERKGDLPSLIRFFLNQKSLKLQKNIPPMGYSTLQQLLDYDWPGNVRELENYIEQLVNFDGKITLERYQNQKKETQKAEPTPTNYSENIISTLSLKEMEKRHIIKALTDNNGNMSQTAKILEISRNTLYLKMKKYQIRQ